MGRSFSEKNITICELVKDVPEDAVIFVMPKKHKSLITEILKKGKAGLLKRYTSLTGTDNLIYCPYDSVDWCGSIENIVAAEYKGLILHRFDNKLSIKVMLDIAHKRDPQVKQDYSELFENLVAYENLIRGYSQKESNAFDEIFMKELHELVPKLCQNVRRFARENKIKNYSKFSEALLKDADYLKRSLEIVFRINDDDDLHKIFCRFAKAKIDGPDRQSYITNLLELFFHYDKDARTYLIDTLGKYKSEIVSECLDLTIKVKDTSAVMRLVLENKQDPKRICEAIQTALYGGSVNASC